MLLVDGCSHIIVCIGVHLRLILLVFCSSVVSANSVPLRETLNYVFVFNSQKMVSEHG